MPYCSDCGKLRGYGEQEPEGDDPDIENLGDGNFQVVGQVRVVLPCSDCSSELKESTLDYEIALSHECKAEPPEGTQEPELEDLSYSFSFTSRMQTEKTNPKTGKITRIKPRYAKTFYGASIEVSGKCGACQEELSGTAEVEEQASYFEVC